LENALQTGGQSSRKPAPMKLFFHHYSDYQRRFFTAFVNLADHPIRNIMHQNKNGLPLWVDPLCNGLPVNLMAQVAFNGFKSRYYEQVAYCY